MAKRENTGKPEISTTKKGVSKYARKFLWRKAHVNGWPLPACALEDVEACRRAMEGKT